MAPVHGEIVVPKSLDDAARASFADALYQVHAQIFDGVERDAFVHYVVDSPAERTRIMDYRDASDRIVGYFAFQVLRRARARSGRAGDSHRRRADGRADFVAAGDR